MTTLRVWVAETRPQFLLLTPVCVFAGIAVALLDGYALDPLYLCLAFVGALCAHMAVNVLNDYFDFRSGVDLKTVRTPFSGGSGIIPSGALKPEEALGLGLGSLAVVVAVGLFFITIYGWAMLPIGIAGVLLVSLYTPLVTKLPGTSEVAAGAGFGLMVLGTYFTQTGTYSLAAVLSTVVAGLLVGNLLLLNEFPDVEADRTGGRRHLPIVAGNSTAAKVYAAVVALTYVAIVEGVVSGVLPVTGLLGLLTLPLGIKAVSGALRNHSDVGGLVPSMAMNVLVVLLTPLFMSIGIVLWTFIA